jgi:biopolymer transport protein ExbB
MKKLLTIFAFHWGACISAPHRLFLRMLKTQPYRRERIFPQVVKDKFIEGDPTYMWPILICLILGLAVSIERVITLNMATTDTKKLLAKIEDALAKGGIEAAKDVTKNTRGPVASIFTQGLMRSSEGVEMVEKSIVSYGGVEMGKLERGLIWISLFISLGPMLGFFGTVIGMIFAFDAIQAAGDISPNCCCRWYESGSYYYSSRSYCRYGASDFL